MRFQPNEDQSTFFTVLEQMMGSGEAGWRAGEDWVRFDWSADFDQLLEENGFFDCAAEDDLGAVAAADMVFRLASLPVTLECAASSLLRPQFFPHLPRPLAVIGDEASAVRFLPVARSILHIGEDGVRAALIEPMMVEPVESIFAYPMGVLRDAPIQWMKIDADPRLVSENWRIAIAAELAGALKGGLESVLAHVRDRKQFGRPLGSFQTVQHRLAGAASSIEAARLLVLKAAQSLDPVDSATALGYVQDASTGIVYDLHQFMGAMGLTLEHPLHRWTYRARLLRSSLGGALGNMQLASVRRWGEA